uniref:Uncharacterized protein n=1 Tax=Panagrolaimus sp. JU765 TaxID=591449 RepID=A0AC34RRC1_9BILA
MESGSKDDSGTKKNIDSSQKRLQIPENLLEKVFGPPAKKTKLAEEDQAKKVGFPLKFERRTDKLVDESKIIKLIETHPTLKFDENSVQVLTNLTNYMAHEVIRSAITVARSRKSTTVDTKDFVVGQAIIPNFSKRG